MTNQETMPDIKVVLLAGGKGTRFWPLSTGKKPKQFLALFNESETLLQTTWARVQSLSRATPLVVTGQEYEQLSRQQLPSAEILAEPCGRNTAASIGWAASVVREQNPVLIVLPSDHLIRNQEAFLATLRDAVQLAATKNSIVTLGIVPESAQTGYGYIERGTPIQYSGQTAACKVQSFKEKPDAATANQYLKSGTYLWNSGMFIFPAAVMLEELQRYEPILYAGLEAFMQAPADQADRLFSQLLATSIDYAVMERSQRVLCLACEDFGWSDVGSWDAWAAELAADEQGNRIFGSGVRAVDCKNTVVRSSGKPIALLGVDDLVVVDTGEQILITHRSRCQDVKIFSS
jgi:mannose-1-phosphate guanylyltransferase/mannose-6-phosphate isomerase